MNRMKPVFVIMAVVSVMSLYAVYQAPASAAEGLPTWNGPDCVEVTPQDGIYNGVTVYRNETGKRVMLTSYKATSTDKLDIYSAVETEAGSSQFGNFSAVPSLNTTKHEYSALVDQDSGRVYLSRYDLGGKLMSCDWDEDALAAANCEEVLDSESDPIATQHVSLTPGYIYTDYANAKVMRYSHDDEAGPVGEGELVYDLNFGNDGLGMHGLHISPDRFALTSSRCDSDYNYCLPESPQDEDDFALFGFVSTDDGAGIDWETPDSPRNTQLLQDPFGYSNQEYPFVGPDDELYYIADKSHVIMCPPSVVVDGDEDGDVDVDEQQPDGDQEEMGEEEEIPTDGDQEEISEEEEDIPVDGDASPDGDTEESSESSESDPNKIQCGDTTAEVLSGDCGLSCVGSNGTEPVEINADGSCELKINNGDLKISGADNLVLQCMGKNGEDEDPVCFRAAGDGRVEMKGAGLSVIGVPTGTVGTEPCMDVGDGVAIIGVGEGCEYWVVAGRLVVSGNTCGDLADCAEWPNYPAGVDCPQLVEDEITIDLSNPNSPQCVETNPCEENECGVFSNGCSQEVDCGPCADGDVDGDIDGDEETAEELEDDNAPDGDAEAAESAEESVADGDSDAPDAENNNDAEDGDAVITKGEKGGGCNNASSSPDGIMVLAALAMAALLRRYGARTR